jgi:hypothetical protein
MDDPRACDASLVVKQPVRPDLVEKASTAFGDASG